MREFFFGSKLSTVDFMQIAIAINCNFISYRFNLNHLLFYAIEYLSTIVYLIKFIFINACILQKHCDTDKKKRLYFTENVQEILLRTYYYFLISKFSNVSRIQTIKLIFLRFFAISDQISVWVKSGVQEYF